MPKTVEQSGIVLDNRLLSPRDLVQLLQVSKSTLRRLEQSGRLLASLRIGNQVRWIPHTISIWLRDEERRSAPHNGKHPKQSLHNAFFMLR